MIFHRPGQSQAREIEQESFKKNKFLHNFFSDQVIYAIILKK